MGVEEVLEYSVKGALVLIGLVGWAILFTLYSLGRFIVRILWDIFCFLRDKLFPTSKEPGPFYQRNQIKAEEPAEIKKEVVVQIEETENTPEESEDIEEPEEEKFVPDQNVYLEKGLDYRKKEELFAHGFKRLKISPFGESGAAYYWVKTRYNEGKDHAFFCYLIAQELRKYTDKVLMDTNNGPDVVVDHNQKHYCFDVETGKSLSRQPESLKRKFDYYRKEYDQSFILVVKKKLKYKYGRYGIVITRGKLKQTIEKLFFEG